MREFCNTKVQAADLATQHSIGTEDRAYIYQTRSCKQMVVSDRTLNGLRLLAIYEDGQFQGTMIEPLEPVALVDDGIPD